MRSQTQRFQGLRASTLGLIALTFACGSREAPPKTQAEPCGCGPAHPCPTGFVCDQALCLAEPAAVPEPVPVQAAPVAPGDRRFELGGTEVFDLASKINGRSYQIMVGPSSKTEPGKRYATIYVLDGYWDFALVNAMRGALHYDQAIPDVIVVGIGYTGLDGGASEIHDLRASDYTPTANEKARPASGKAPEFLRFIEDELFPFIESSYPSDPTHRVLAGVSFGGLFTLYALFERPELFYGYVAMTPAVGWDDGFIVRRERDFRKTHPSLSARLWLSVGGDEEPEKLAAQRAFFSQVERARYRELELRTRVIDGERHAAMKNESYNRGLRFVLAPLAPKPSK